MLNNLCTRFNASVFSSFFFDCVVKSNNFETAIKTTKTTRFYESVMISRDDEGYG